MNSFLSLKKAYFSARTIFVLCVLYSSNFAVAQDTVLKLDWAISMAIKSDPWLNGSRQRERALISESVSASSLPDPQISLTALNFPIDTFNFDQEPMTQVRIGVAQMLPRGDSLNLSSRQKRELSAQEPALRLDREAKVAAMVAKLWLEAFAAQQSIRLIKADRSLFEQLVDVTRANYSSALGRARQQDVIRAQLELTRIEDRLTVLQQQLESAQQRLSEWIGAAALLPLPTNLPTDVPILSQASLLNAAGRDQSFYEQVKQHPSLLAIDLRIQSMETGVDLARQKYKPAWSVKAEYGYRGDDPNGRDRADFLSLGVSFDLPLFTTNRQDQDVRAAVSRTEALKTDRQLLARQLVAQMDVAVVELNRLDERYALYEQQLLPQMAEQAEAALSAYNNDDGDFAEAVRARIAELNAKIDALNIAVSQQQTITTINYLLSGTANEDVRPQVR